ncbi:hypothetical protein P3X46_013982 [Hevea brasiliensis]|uniref:DUF4005 domain-containing protein n=1 Tax=Hevea brasiliensis TaxID=3981 RepID=A0ABQ9M7B0_HEVBR|nr:uncharacterized protein LOC110654612 [Hevea brasiliensis]XP_021666334.1 uncharacterized protein LOC110654612 [Hevea brasiliensis]KAJ9175425.1 hypothetical protein P3X46_013982 [Hevea brasiliensis]KAJ9175426.1 hypothetical protein P3X46_013982 [Hevea brasiliensis]
MHSDQEMQDQRTNSGMEDSTTKTVEFLRARLLSERSVSRSARQRADELAKRVAELEEQLRIVCLQRMKAEKATTDVLAILEGNGISDISETFDSSSDPDTPYESKVGNRSSKEEENSVSSKIRNNETQELSGSDIEFSSVTGRSLSWKGCKDSSCYLEKYKDTSLRRRSNFSSVGSSPKHCPGKSCRQIRRKESRSVAEELKANPAKVDAIEDEVAITSENFPNCPDVKPGIFEGVVERGEDKMLLGDSLSSCLGNGQNMSSNGIDYNVYGGDRDMEKALEHQAQLIGQYEAMEKAQREWEEKFRENNNSTPDSCDPGNHSDITEERYEIKGPATNPAITIASQTNELRSEVADFNKIQPNGFLSSSHVDVASLQERESSSMPVSNSSTQDFAFPMVKGKQNQDSPGNNYHPPLHVPHHDSVSHGSHYSPGSQYVSSLPSNTSSSLSKLKDSGGQNELYALVPHRTSNGVGGVLEALKEAKQALQQKLPLVAASVGKSVEHSVPATMPRDKGQIPVGCVGLFRVPTDFSVEANARADFISSIARLSLGNYYPSTGVPAAVSNPFVSSPYLESRPNLSTEDQFLTSQYVGGSRIPTQKPYFDPYLDTGLPSSSRYTYPNYPINTSYPDLMPRMPAREAPSASVPGRTVGVTNLNHFSFIDDNIRPNTYRP